MATPKTPQEKLADQKDLMAAKLKDPEFQQLSKQVKVMGNRINLEAALEGDMDLEASVGEHRKVAKARARINRTQQDQNTITEAAKLDKDQAEAVKPKGSKVSDALQVLVAEGKLTKEQAQAMAHTPEAQA